MTVNELIEVLKKFDGDLEVVSAIPETAYDRDAYPEDLKIDSIEECDFEADDNYRALVFKADRWWMPSLRDWNDNYPHGIPWKEKE